MDTTLHRRVKVISLISLAVFVIVTVIGFVAEIDILQPLGVFFSIIPLFSLPVIYFIQYRSRLQKNWISFLGWCSPILFFFSLFLIAFAIDSNWSPILIILMALLTFLFVIATIIRLFLFNLQSTLGIIIAMILILVAFGMKKMHWPGAGYLIAVTAILMAFGMYASGLASLFIIPKNRFLKNTVFIAGIMLTFAFLALLFKLNHWPGANILIMLSQIPVLVLTLLFILLLPRSGYFEWNNFEKRVLGRTLIPWTFFLVLISAFYLYPKSTSFIFSSGKPPVSFEMFNFYTPENKNGLLPE
jgi:hypothetical protein